jgi:hypothetical protein
MLSIRIVYVTMYDRWKVPGNLGWPVLKENLRRFERSTATT